MKHILYLVTRANNPTGLALQQRPDDVPDDGKNEHISGHALMASCPPPPPLEPFSCDENPVEPLDITRASFANLLGLCEKLPGLKEKELPPIKAWAKLKQDERFPRLSAADFQQLQERLLPDVQCHR